MIIDTAMEAWMAAMIQNAVNIRDSSPPVEISSFTIGVMATKYESVVTFALIVVEISVALKVEYLRSEHLSSVSFRIRE